MKTLMAIASSILMVAAFLLFVASMKSNQKTLAVIQIICFVANGIILLEYL